MTKKIIKKNHKKIVKNCLKICNNFLLVKNDFFRKKNCKNKNKKSFFNNKNIKLISTKKYFQNKKSSIKSFYSKTTNYDSKKKNNFSLNNNFNKKSKKNNKKIKFFTENNKIVLIKVFKENDLNFNKYNFVPQIFWQEEDNDILSNDEQINRDYKKSIFNLFNTMRKIKNVPEYLNKKLYNKLNFK